MTLSPPPSDADPSVQFASPERPAEPPDHPSSSPHHEQQRFRRRSFGRWLMMAPVRLLYRVWTRIAARAFPEDSHRAQVAERMGISLPDRLDMSWVTGRLAVGGRIRVEDIARLAATGITCVVDTRAEYRDDEAALNREGIQLLYLPTPDTYPLSVEQLLDGTAWILKRIHEGQKVLIHCEHGVGRSVLLICATLVRDGYSAEDATRLVQAKRWQASPNHRQIKRLHEFEEVLRTNAQNQPDQAGASSEYAL